MNTAASPIRLASAAQFSLDALTAAYNQARADYLIPMPMDAARLAEYMRVYDVDLPGSLVALDGGALLGLAMLGARPGRAWVTRLGVLPGQRRRGTGEALVRGLLEAAARRGLGRAVLEVIEGNEPARGLFARLGFEETRRLLVLRRPAAPPPEPPRGRPQWLAAPAALALLREANLGGGWENPLGLAWTNEVESFRNAPDTRALALDLGAEGRGWLAYRREPGALSHFVFHTQAGDPAALAAALLAHLYARWPRLESSVENVPAADPHLPALARFGCAEVFRRIEMVRG